MISIFIWIAVLFNGCWNDVVIVTCACLLNHSNSNAMCNVGNMTISRFAGGIGCFVYVWTVYRCTPATARDHKFWNDDNDYASFALNKIVKRDVYYHSLYYYFIDRFIDLHSQHVCDCAVTGVATICVYASFSHNMNSVADILLCIPCAMTSEFDPNESWFFLSHCVCLHFVFNFTELCATDAHRRRRMGKGKCDALSGGDSSHLWIQYYRSAFNWNQAKTNHINGHYITHRAINFLWHPLCFRLFGGEHYCISCADTSLNWICLHFDRPVLTRLSQGVENIG